MARFVFFLLLLVILALGTHLWLSSQAQKADFRLRERNADEVRVVAVTPPSIAARRVEDARRTQQSLVGAACVEFSGIAAADALRARESFAALALGPRLTERRVEEITRFWVYIPPIRDRRALDARVAELRRHGLADLSVRPDNAISLGVFSSEDAARRFLTSIEVKGVRGAEVGAFAREMREIVMLVREPDSELVARLAVLQREFPASQLRAVPCPGA